MARRDPFASHSSFLGIAVCRYMAYNVVRMTYNVRNGPKYAGKNGSHHSLLTLRHSKFSHNMKSRVTHRFRNPPNLCLVTPDQKELFLLFSNPLDADLPSQLLTWNLFSCHLKCRRRPSAGYLDIDFHLLPQESWPTLRILAHPLP